MSNILNIFFHDQQPPPKNLDLVHVVHNETDKPLTSTKCDKLSHLVLVTDKASRLLCETTKVKTGSETFLVILGDGINILLWIDIC